MAEKINVKYTPNSAPKNTFTHDELHAAMKYAVAVSDYRDKFNLVIDREVNHWFKSDILAKLKAARIEVSPSALSEKHVGKVEVYFFVGDKKAGKMEVTLEKEAPAVLSAWPDNVICSASFSSVDKGVRTKAVEVAETGGRGSHGAVILAKGGKECQHWTVGSTTRIFGTFASGKLTILGWGPHGNTNQDYNVTLAGGGTTTARVKK